MGLFTFDPSHEGGSSYLGTSIKQRIKPLREQKLRLVNERLGISEIQRPAIDTCDIHDTPSIMRFFARENLDCAFYCEPDTSVERVEELCDIILGDISSGKYIHIIPHANTEVAARDKTGSDMFGYFEVWIKDIPQNQSHKTSAISRFKAFYLQAQFNTFQK